MPLRYLTHSNQSPEVLNEFRALWNELDLLKRQRVQTIVGPPGPAGEPGEPGAPGEGVHNPLQLWTAKFELFEEAFTPFQTKIYFADVDVQLGNDGFMLLDAGWTIVQSTLGAIAPYKVQWSLRGTSLFVDPLLPHNPSFNPFYYRQEFIPPTAGVHYPLTYNAVSGVPFLISDDFAFVPVRPANGEAGTLTLRIQWENQAAVPQLLCHSSLFWGYYVNFPTPLFAQTICPFA